MILNDFLALWFPLGWIFEASLAWFSCSLAPFGFNFWCCLGSAWFSFGTFFPLWFLWNPFGSFEYQTFLIMIVFVWFWNFQKTLNRLRNFAVGIWRHEYAHGICSGWKYHVAFHDRHTRILWNTGRSCFFMIRCLILLSTQQLTDICLCVCSTPQFIIFSMATV